MKARKYKPRPGTWVVAVSAKVSKTHKRENHYFSSENAAKEWIVRFKHEHAEHGQAAISSEERRWINFFRDSVGDLSTLPKVVEHWQTTGPDCITKTTVADAVEHFLDWRSRQGRWSPSTAEDTVSRLGIFTRSLGDRLIHELRPTEIEDFLGVRGEAGTRVKFFNKLRPVFRYAKRHRFVAIDPMEDIRPPAIEYKEIEIYAPDEMARMLAVAEESAPDLVPFLALMAFGFLRTEELIPRFDGDVVLDWTAFDWTDRQIFVPHTVAKKARNHGGNDRQIPFNEAMLHWLEPYIKPSGGIVKREKIAAYRALKKIRTKAEVRDVDNGLRHSCLTMWMAANGDESIGTVSRWSGNSPAICKRHYVATVKSHEGKAWFGIRR